MLIRHLWGSRTRPSVFTWASTRLARTRSRGPPRTGRRPSRSWRGLRQSGAAGTGGAVGRDGGVVRCGAPRTLREPAADVVRRRSASGRSALSGPRERTFPRRRSPAGAGLQPPIICLDRVVRILPSDVRAEGTSSPGTRGLIFSVVYLLARSPRVSDGAGLGMSYPKTPSSCPAWTR